MNTWWEYAEQSIARKTPRRRGAISTYIRTHTPPGIEFTLDDLPDLPREIALREVIRQKFKGELVHVRVGTPSPYGKPGVYRRVT